MFLWILIILGNFTFLKDRGNFSSPQAGLASFLLHFSNSAICQTMPVAVALIHAMSGRHIQFFWLRKGCGATAQALGQLPLWIFDYYVATSNISSMSLTVIGEGTGPGERPGREGVYEDNRSRSDVASRPLWPGRRRNQW